MAELSPLPWTCGACPVQIEGELTDGRKFYFRYRHAFASLAVGEYPQGVVEQSPGGPDVVTRRFSDRDPLDGSLEIAEAQELLASMAAELPVPT